MSISTPDSFVELRFQVPMASLEAACEAIAPYVLRMPEEGRRDPRLPAAPARSEGVTQKEIEMLLREYAPSGR